MRTGRQVSYLRYIVEEGNLIKGELRNATADSCLVIPVECPHRIFVTSRDVIHSFRITSCGIKADGEPGRLNQVRVLLSRAGPAFGICSELCGAGHAFIPINVIGVPLNEYVNYITPPEPTPTPPVINKVEDPVQLEQEEEHDDNPPFMWKILKWVKWGVVFWVG